MKFPHVSIGRLLIVTLTITLVILATACRQGSNQLHDHTHGAVATTPPTAAPLMLTSTQERLANIRVQRMISANVSDGTLISARVVADEDRRITISSRAAGRIEKLYVKEAGRPIAAGQPLYDLYSERLNGQIQEYLILKDQYTKLGNQRDHYASLLKGAENKLILYGLTHKQIEHFTRATARITFLAPASGTVTELLVTEGQYVEEGTLMVRLDNLAKLWLETDLYPNEATSFRPGDIVSVRLSGITKPVAARVSFLTPVFRDNAQIVVMRATLDNRNGSLTPGMQATLQRQQQDRQVLQLPLDAVIRNGKNAYAFVRAADHTYTVRVVKTGAENATSIEITDGLSASDEVVQSGAYLLYSELVLRHGTDFMTQNTSSN
ncbi:MAG TPA: efflux RND transporter periplasmic adaptor subunit [Chryseolinea sp.]|nr:efflux RND transporter periplasmic adaptor subunit [Chryseolinea sp.]